MVGAGESYLPAFALSMGLTPVWVGLFTTLPMLIGSVLQLLTPYLVFKFKSVRHYVVISTALQAMSFVPLIWFSILGSAHPIWLFISVAFYWGFGFAAGPTWNVWMEQIVTKHESTHYLARRAQVSQIGIILGLVGGGLVLQSQIKGQYFTAFTIVFLIAFLARSASSLSLYLKSYSNEWHFKINKISLFESAKKFYFANNYRSFFGFLFIFTISIFISGPFVAPYFLAHLKLSYLEFMLAISTLFIAKIMVLPFAEKAVHKFGVKNVFLIGAVGISPLPAFWYFSESLIFVIGLQFISGAFWALYEVSLTFLFFNHLKVEEKIPVLTIYNLYNALAFIIGSSIGAVILKSYEGTDLAFYMLFAFGAGLRTLIAGVYAFQMRTKKILSE
jgi:MFS family permease